MSGLRRKGRTPAYKGRKNRFLIENSFKMQEIQGNATEREAAIDQEAWL